MRTQALFALGIWVLGAGGGALAEDLEPGAEPTRLRGRVSIPSEGDRAPAREPTSEPVSEKEKAEKPEGQDVTTRSAVHKRQGAGGRVGM